MKITYINEALTSEGCTNTMNIKTEPTISEQRRERERAEMETRILDVAREMFVRDGYEAVTLRKIAKAIEYSPATIYQYFKDKQSLVLAIIRNDYLALRNTLLECMEIKDHVERVIEMARRYAVWGITHPNHYRLLLLPPPAWTVQKQDLWQQDKPPLEKDALYLLRSFVEEGIRAGLLKDKYTDAGLVAATLWAGLHGLVLLEITMHEREPFTLNVAGTSFQHRFDTIIKVFRDGLLKES